MHEQAVMSDGDAMRLKTTTTQYFGTAVAVLHVQYY